MGFGGHIVAAARGVLQGGSEESRVSEHEPAAETGPSRRNAYRYNAFISYHRETDGDVAPAFRDALHRFAKPWYRLSAVSVFLDDASMGSGPLRSTIERALDESEFFVLLASPEAAAREWVNREVQYWRRTKREGPVLLVLTAGERPVWDEEHGDFDWARHPPLPHALRGAFREEPRWSDLREAKQQGDLTLRNPNFRRAVVDVAAALHHRSREAIEGEDVRQHRRTILLARLTALALVLLTVAAVGAAIYAVRQRDDARAERDLATSRFLAAQAESEFESNLPRSLLLSVEGLDSAESTEAKSTLLRGIQEAADARVRFFLDGGADSRALAFSPGDPSTLAAGDEDGAIDLWDVQSGRRLGLPLAGHKEAVGALQFNPKAPEVLASGGADGKVLLWDLERREARELPFGEEVDAVLSVAFSADGKTLAASTMDSRGSRDFGAIFRWSLPSGDRLGRKLYMYDYLPVFELAFSPESDRNLVGISAGIQVWDVGLRGRNAFGVSRGRFPVYGLAHASATSAPTIPEAGFTFRARDGLLAFGGAVAGDGRISFEDVERQKPVGEPLVRPRDPVTDVAFNPHDEDVLASAGAGGTITLWDVRRGEPLGQSFGAEGHSIEDLEFSSDGQALASIDDNGTVVVWDVEEGQALGTALGASGAPVGDLLFNSNGDRLASVHDDGSVKLWDVRALRGLRPFLSGEPAYGSSVVFSSTGDGLIEAYGAGDMVVLRDLQRDEAVGTLDTGGVTIADVAFSPDGKQLAGTTQEGRVVLLDVEERGRLGTPFTNLRPGMQNVGVAWSPPLAFSPDGQTFAAAHESGRVVLWDIQQEKRLEGRFAKHEALVWGLAFSPDGERLASASSDGTIILSRVDGQGEVARLASPVEGLVSLAFSLDGELVAAAGTNGRTVLWDIERQQQVGDPFSGSSPIAFRPDGRKLASADADGGIMLWDTDVKSWTERACAVVNRNLTQEEWDRFVGGPYERTCPSLPAGEGVSDRS